MKVKEKEKILEFATKKFLKEGFHKTTMDSISSEIHMSKKTIYKYFPTKERLIESIIDNTQKENRIFINKIVSSKDNFIKVLISLLVFYQKDISRTGENWIKDLKIHMPHLWNKVQNFNNTIIIPAIEKFIKKGKKEKYIRNIPTPIIIKTTESIIETICDTEFAINNKLSIQDIFHHNIDVLLNGLLTQKVKLESNNSNKYLSF